MKEQEMNGKICLWAERRRRADLSFENARSYPEIGCSAREVVGFGVEWWVDV